jgi:deazaflavin-dependent oxidoreductase (nitroreductase family)
MGLVLPTALLETRGARTGAVRRNVLIYFHDSERVTIVASKLGYERHPAWFHNPRADPDVVFGGLPMRATVITDESERRRLWTLADRVFAPYAAYRREAAESRDPDRPAHRALTPAINPPPRKGGSGGRAPPPGRGRAGRASGGCA